LLPSMIRTFGMNAAILMRIKNVVLKGFIEVLA